MKYLFLMLILSLISCQNSQSLLVKSFFEDVFSNDKELGQISKEYRYPWEKNTANELFIKNIEFLKSDKEHLNEQLKGLKVEPYAESTIGNLWLFDTQEGEDIYVVSFNNQVECYVLLKNSKILSFVYFRKGSDSQAYFIPYYEVSTYQ